MKKNLSLLMFVLLLIHLTAALTWAAGTEKDAQSAIAPADATSSAAAIDETSSDAAVDAASSIASDDAASSASDDAASSTAAVDETSSTAAVDAASSTASVDETSSAVTADETSSADTADAAPSAEADDREWLYELNRQSIANMSIEEGPVYVIGHRSPDSDTVCSAIAYARLLTMLGYPAEAAIAEPVNRETAYILKTAGVEAPQVLEDAAGKSIFLVDHSEYAQAAEGMEDAHIVGILDHHGVGSVTTGHQLVYEAKPIGATATIIWLDYMNYGLEIDKETATLLLGAILSDTSNLTISSVTEADRQAVDRLAGLAEIADVKEFYLALHTEALSFGDMSDEEIFFSDYKEYEASGVKFGIGLIPALDEERAKEMAERMKNALPGSFKKANVDLLYADIGIREGDVKVDYIIPCEGQSKEVFEATFPNYDEYDGTSYIFRNGGLGRKSKLVPGLTEYLNAHPHE